MREAEPILTKNVKAGVSMGKRMDTAVFLSVFFVAVFVLLLFSGKDVRIIAVLSAVSALCMGVIAKSIHRKTKSICLRKKRNTASKQAKRLIYKENMDALNEIMSLLNEKYNIHSKSIEGGRMYFKEGTLEDVYELFIIRKFKASPDDILSVWREEKKVKPIKGILFVIPGKMDTDVKLMRYRIDSPNIRILDSSTLKTLYRKYGTFPNTATLERRVNPIGFFKSALNRKRALRYLAYALLLIGYYLISGNLLYLLIGAFLAFICLFSFFSNMSSDKLFS